ncbi:hypothetical protein [Coprobacter fastidiosus]
MEKLLKAFRILENRVELPAEYKAHMLKGEHECHIE